MILLHMSVPYLYSSAHLSLCTIFLTDILNSLHQGQVSYANFKLLNYTHPPIPILVQPSLPTCSSVKSIYQLPLMVCLSHGSTSSLHPSALLPVSNFLSQSSFFHGLSIPWFFLLVFFFPVLKLSSIHRSWSVHLVLPPSLPLLGYHYIAFVNACLSIRTFITHTSFLYLPKV